MSVFLSIRFRAYKGCLGAAEPVWLVSTSNGRVAQKYLELSGPSLFLGFAAVWERGMIDIYDVVARGEEGGGRRVIDLSLRLSIHHVSPATHYFIIYSVILRA